MSDRIVRALMQLFAIVASAGQYSSRSRNIVELFLGQQISRSHIARYLAWFDEQLAVFEGKARDGSHRKRISVQSVKVLRICTEINNELEHQQKIIVLLRLLEFIHASGEGPAEQEIEFVSTVADVFHIGASDPAASRAIAAGATPPADLAAWFLTAGAPPREATSPVRHLDNDTLGGTVWVLFLKQNNLLFARYEGKKQLTVNGQAVARWGSVVFSPGSVIRGVNVDPVYYSDVIRCFMQSETEEGITFSVEHIEYFFRNGKQGLHDLSFTASSGNLIGIMGGSGAGKSTLLNILNSNLAPRSGHVRINGVDVHEGALPDGIIGYVPQDDLLIEELTVFQNLYYNTLLCHRDLSPDQAAARVDRQLEALGLSDTRNLPVGDVLNKTISGGQRKRLNIALELIRTPAVLFVDEPTSGLSSIDSENVMDLLKQLANAGKLVFVVIHQPSSDIYRLFDRLLILDTGGYPVYYGDPSDALIYFKTRASYADAAEAECGTCGNLNPELVFSILESRVLDEFGQPTTQRKVTPTEWNAWYREREQERPAATKPPALPENQTQKPSRLRQLILYMRRDVMAKLRNTQYLLINFLEAPVLALVLASFLKYSPPGSPYRFEDNLNLPAFLFISIIVALFMGLTVSAEEIIHDRKIRLREAFLNLSRGSYLSAKCLVLFGIGAIQTGTYLAVAMPLIGIRDMFAEYWLVLFSVSCFANLLGLNISAAFRSVVTVYILIPFLIIPQIILSGVMVRFDDLNPRLTNRSHVPLIGEIMASRWAFEALAVHQYSRNRYERHYFGIDRQMTRVLFEKDFRLLMLNDKLDSAFRFPGAASADRYRLLSHELEREPGTPFGPVTEATLTPALHARIREHIRTRRNAFIKEYKVLRARRDTITQQLIRSLGGEDGLRRLKQACTNESLGDLVQNKADFDAVAVIGDRIQQRFRPVYMDSPGNRFRAPLYVSRKNVLGRYAGTFGVNVAVIWLMGIVLALLLYADGLKHAFGALERATDLIRRRPA